MVEYDEDAFYLLGIKFYMKYAHEMFLYVIDHVVNSNIHHMLS
jgi:hypothetical protein